MGWLWSSQSSANGANGDSTTTTQLPPAQAQAQAQAPPAPSYSDPEIAKFMAQIQSEFGSTASSEPAAPVVSTSSKTSVSHTELAKVSPPASSLSSSSSSATESPWRSLWGPAAQSETEPSSTSSRGVYTNPAATERAATPQQPDRLDPISESLLPTTMSCRNALDAAFYCQSPGGQWNSVYREGNVRSCSDHWDDLWFCMRTRAMTGKMKEEAIQDHYRRKELAKYGPGRPSSQDVWESRDVKVEPGTAFTERYEPPSISDEEWWALEIRNRRAVQEALARERRS